MGKHFDLNTFTFNGHTLRAVMIDGKPWFHNKDVLSAIGNDPRYTQNIKTVVDADEYRVLNRGEMAEWHSETHHLFPDGKRGGANAVSLVSESGLYRFTLRARRSNPAAREFQDWITKHVIPAIRQRGG